MNMSIFSFSSGRCFVRSSVLSWLDYFLLRRGALRTEDLYREGGPYWFTHGVNLVALLAWIVGFMIYMGFSAMLMEKVLGVKTALALADRILPSQHDRGRRDLLGS